MGYPNRENGYGGIADYGSNTSSGAMAEGAIGPGMRQGTYQGQQAKQAYVGENLAASGEVPSTRKIIDKLLEQADTLDKLIENMGVVLQPVRSDIVGSASVLSENSRPDPTFVITELNEPLMNLYFRLDGLQERIRYLTGVVSI